MAKIFHHPDYDAQEVEWELFDDVYRGPAAIREKITKYLPMTELERRETDRQGPAQHASTRDPMRNSTRYTDRAERSVLVNGIRRLVRYAVSNLFLSDPKIQTDKMAPRLAGMVANCDRMGTPLVEFIKSTCARSYLFGHYFVLIDAPRAVNSLADDRRKGGPFLVAISPRDIVNWSVSEVNGEFSLDWVMHRQYITRQPNPMEEPVLVELYRVWFPNTWEDYEMMESTVAGGQKLTEPRLIDSGVHDLGVVPLVGIYSQPLRPMVSDPPLSEAVWLNIDHFRMMSAFANGLYYHLSPILAFIGISEDSEVKVGAGYSVNLPTGAEGKYIEYQGGSMKVAYDAIQGLATEVMESGLRSSSFLGANTSAEARRLAKSDYNASLKFMANSFSHGFGQVLQIAHLWINKEVTAADVAPIFNQDFDVVVLDANACSFLLNARKSGEISRERFLKELQRGEVIDRTANVETEITAAKKDGPSEVAEKSSANAPDAGSGQRSA